MNFTLKMFASTAVLAAVVPHAAANPITMATWGGAYGKSQQETFVKDFMQKTGVKVLVEDYSGGLAQIRSQVKTGKVTWDVVDLEMQDAVRACDEGLLERMDAGILAASKDGTPAADDYAKGAITRCAVGSLTWANIIAYNDTRFSGAKPASARDFFDLKKFPGKRGMKKAARANLELALLADGVPLADVYKVLAAPGGIERALKKLDTIKGSIVWWEAGAQPPQLLSSGEVVMTTAYSGRVYDAIVVDKQPFKLIWDGQVQVSEVYGIVKGSKNLATARQLIAAGTTPEVLAAQTRFVSYGPLRKSAMQYVDAKVMPYLPTAPENTKTALQLDADWWSENIDEVNQKFAAWLSK